MYDKYIICVYTLYVYIWHLLRFSTELVPCINKVVLRQIEFFLYSWFYRPLVAFTAVSVVFVVVYVSFFVLCFSVGLGFITNVEHLLQASHYLATSFWGFLWKWLA